MAHDEQRVFFDTLKKHLPEYFYDTTVLEVGSLNINGTVRDFFDTDDYTGCDVGDGPGVDIVCGGEKLNYADNTFDVAVSAECFEHNPHWVQTFENMVRMTRIGGLVAFTCATTGRPEHGTARSDAGSSPLTTALGWDYYRNLKPADFVNEARDSLTPFQTGRGHFFINPKSCDLYFAGLVGIDDPRFDAFISDMKDALE